MSRLAFIKWYPNDWLAEPSLRACSLAARGLWIDMLSLMHLSPRRGYLLAASGLPISPEQLARLTGCSADEVNRLLGELHTSGVYSSSADGLIFSRRMVREESRREELSEYGKKGGLRRVENMRDRLKPKPKPDPKPDPKPNSSHQKPEAREDKTPSESCGEVGLSQTPSRPTPDSPHHRSVAFWCDEWQKVHGSKYPFAKKDGVHVRDILRHLEGSEERFRAVARAYLADDDKFVADKNHPLGLLVSGLVKYSAARAAPKSAIPFLDPKEC